MPRSACLVLAFGALGALQPAVALAGIKPHCRDLTFAGAAGAASNDKVTLRVVDASGATLDESCQLQVQNNESARAFAARLVAAWGSGNGITCPPPPDPLPPKTCGNGVGGKSCQHKFKFKPDKLTVDPDDGLIRVRICCKESPGCTGLVLANTPVSAQTKVDPAVVFEPSVPPPAGVTSTPVALDPIGLTQRPHAALQGCRKDVGIAADAAYPHLLRRTAQCMDDIAAGTTPAGACSPPFPADPELAAELTAARQRVLDAATESCASTSSPPSEYGYGSCPPPCATITIAGWSDVAACLNCQAEVVIFGAIGAAYGPSGPVPGLPLGAQQCQAGIGQALSYLADRLLLLTRKCQEAGDKGKGAVPAGMTCLDADPNGLRELAEMKTQEFIQKDCLDTQAFVGLQTCGFDVTSVVACITTQGHGVADKIATAVWPELHGGSPSGAFLEESGL